MRQGVAIGDWEATDLSDDELEALALASAPDAPLGEDALPLSLQSASSHLPSWYMPAVTTVRCKGWHRVAVVAIVAALLTLEVLGLCSIFGQVVIG